MTTLLSAPTRSNLPSGSLLYQCWIYSHDKVEGLDTAITFLSIEIDSKSQELRLPAGNFTNYYKVLTSGKKKERLKKKSYYLSLDHCHSPQMLFQRNGYSFNKMKSQCF